MPSPFPGMDPYLENTELWPEVHHRLITALADSITPLIPEQYRVAIEKRTYLSDPENSVVVGIPDVAVSSPSRSTGQDRSPLTVEPRPTGVATATRTEPINVTMPMPARVRESYLEIREVATGYVITAIEVLSPTNKRSGEGRQAYERKRQQILASVTHLVEIDLLRGGLPMTVLGEIPKSDYRILVSREDRRPQAQLYAFSVRESIPSFLLPLRSGDTEPLVELQVLLNEVYERARYHLAVNYATPPVPPLKIKDRDWADKLLGEKF